MSERKYYCKVQFGHRKPCRYVAGFTATRDSISLHFSDDPVLVSSEVCKVVSAVVPHLNISPYVHYSVLNQLVCTDVGDDNPRGGVRQ